MALTLPVLDLIPARTELLPVEAPHPLLDARALASYDAILVMMSGGKDSVALVLSLLEAGAEPSKIELWHHLIDGAPEAGPGLMDWPCTPGYVRAFAKAFDLPVYFSWREGGFEREMLREDSRTAAVVFECPDGTRGQAGGINGPLGTRRKFPQPGMALSTRWCSSALKIDVAAAAISNQSRFTGKRVLVVTGERAQESAGRAKYAPLEAHKTDRRDSGRRHVDQYRAVHQWSTEHVWSIIERWGVNPHPSYQLGWSRCSCQACIFGGADQWATIRLIDPARFERIAAYEAEFGVTIHRTLSVRDLADRGRPYSPLDPATVAVALSEDYQQPIRLAQFDWQLPLGAYGNSTGPT
jgi:3'-phosphoadenosine 5'-phosphosulfate sulfotransferase (PAPS reductase)/FAD synthetase